MRRFWVVGAILWLVTAPVAGKAADPANVIRALADQAITIIKDDTLSSADRRPKLEQLFKTAMDIPFLGRFSVGRYWRQMSPAEQKEYLAAFEKYLLNSYAGRLNQYSGEAFRVTGSRAVDERDTIVSSQLLRPGSEAVLIDWRVRRKGDNLKVIDISVEGVSMALTQRQEFGSILQREGTSGLIKRLSAQRGDPGPPG